MTIGPSAVVDASLAGVHAADALLEHPEVDSAIVFGREPHRPYDWPPLSKQPWCWA